MSCTNAIKNSEKSVLLELLQRYGIPPQGVKFDIEMSGPTNCALFECKLLLPPIASFRGQECHGWGKTKKAAEHDAASLGLKALECLSSTNSKAQTGCLPNTSNRQQLTYPSQYQDFDLPEPTHNLQSNSALYLEAKQQAGGQRLRHDSQASKHDESQLLLLCEASEDLSMEDANIQLRKARAQIKDLQAQMAELQLRRREDRGKIKLAAQILLAQGPDYLNFVEQVGNSGAAGNAK